MVSDLGVIYCLHALITVLHIINILQTYQKHIQSFVRSGDMSLRIPSSPRGQRCCRPAETDRNHTCSLGVPGSLSYYISTSNHVSKKLPELPKNIQSVTSGKNTYKFCTGRMHSIGAEHP